MPGVARAVDSGNCLPTKGVHNPRRVGTTLIGALAMLLGVTGCSVAPWGGAPGEEVGEWWSADTLPALSLSDFHPILEGVAICPDAGYLCVAGRPTGELQIQRWPDTRSHLTIRVPLPDLPSRNEALRMQQAVVRGLLAWDGHPFSLRILDRDIGDPTPVDFSVEWVPELASRQIGWVRYEWGHRGRNFLFQVLSFQIALGVVDGDFRSLTPEEVQRVAAHEMGHALGLPHSDSPRDLMYPLNTAEFLSVRDYRTLEMLYSLPNGARIQGVR